MNAIATKHNLDFESAPSPYDFHGTNEMVYRVGTCHGQWGCTNDSYYILSIINTEPGNGHLNDVFEWFEHSAKRDGKNLLVLECMNEKFHKHLIEKRGFIPLDAKGDNCIKIFNQKQYKRLLKNGNELIRKGSLTCY